MPKKSIILLPETERILEQMGLQIKYARLRRKHTANLVAKRAGISRATLVSIEKRSVISNYWMLCCGITCT